MTRATANVTFRAFKAAEIEDEFQRYCARLGAELDRPVDHRKKLEAPPACRVEMPTYWQAVLESLDLKDLGRDQFLRLVQDSAGNLFVARQPSKDREAVWLRTAGQKVERTSGRVRLLVDVVEVGPFERSSDPLSHLRRLVDDAQSLFRADVIDRGLDLLMRLAPGVGENPLPDLSITMLRNLLLEGGVEMPLPNEHGHRATWADDQASESLCRSGVSLTEAVRLVWADRLDKEFGANDSSELGVTRSERVKELKKEFQVRRSKRLGLPRDPLAPEIRKDAALARLSIEIDEILKDLHQWARIELALAHVRPHLETAKERARETIDRARLENGAVVYAIGRSTVLAAAEARLARYETLTDDPLRAAFHWAPEWTETMLSGSPADIANTFEEIAAMRARRGSERA